MQLMVWGIGNNTRRIIDQKYIDENLIFAFIDSDNRVKSFADKPVYSPKTAVLYIDKVDYILVTVSSYKARHEIYEIALSLGIDDSKLVFLHNKDLCLKYEYIHNQNEDVLDLISERLCSDAYGQDSIKWKKAQMIYKSDSFKRSFLGSGIFAQEEYMNDYVRFRTFELVAQDIENRNLEGSTAEVGVFRGAFSKLIHAYMPTRVHFMYDSFEGFKTDEALHELQMGTCDENFIKFYKLNAITDVNSVLKDMPIPEKCIIRQGFFPESLEKTDYEERFVFVSLDVDFEESTYQSLKFFYPRVVHGGAMFIHDYNAGSVQRAIKRYGEDCSELINGVHLADRSGTFVITR